MRPVPSSGPRDRCHTAGMLLRAVLLVLALAALACGQPCPPGSYTEDGVCFPSGGAAAADSGDSGDSGDADR